LDEFQSWHSLYPVHFDEKASSGNDNDFLTSIWQAGAPFGSCKNISVPSTSPVTNTAGSFTGSVQFSKSASPVHHPNCLHLVVFYFLQSLVAAVMTKHCCLTYLS